MVYKSRHKLINGKNWHPKNVQNFNGTVENLVDEIVEMDYSTLNLLFEKLSINIERQAEKDELSGKSKLSRITYDVSEYLLAASEGLNSVKKLSSSNLKSSFNINGFEGNLESLVFDIGDLDYVEMEDFFKLLSESLKNKSDKILNERKPKFSRIIEDVSDYVLAAAIGIKSAKNISKPYMYKE